MGGGSQPAQTTQVSKVELPAWVNEASQSNYQLATDIANRPLQQYQGDTVAAPSTMTTQGYGMLGANANAPSGVTGIDPINPTGQTDATRPIYDQARSLLTQSASPLDINPYLNPYTNEVEQRAIGNANTSLQQSLLANSDAARKAGAFGGSRHGVTEGVTTAEGIKGIGDLSARLRQAGFDTATSTALADRSGMRATAGGLLSTAGGLQNSMVTQQNSLQSQQQQQMAKRQQDQDITIQNIAALLGAGGQETGSRQALIDAAQKKFYEARDYPIEGLNTRLAALGMSPYGKTETSNKVATSEDKGPDWATILLGGAKALPGIMGMFSDRTAKTDIVKLSDGEIPMYAYRYKGDPKTYPKVVGPMAQDVEKKFPKAVKKIGGKRVINLENLLESLS